jgi:Protein of unknown function (DUF559)
MQEMTGHCVQCQRPFQLTTNHQRTRLRAGKPVYCSDTCRRERCARISSETMARTNRIYASARMTINNPMHREEARRKVQAALQAMAHAPTIRGGNGKGPTLPQKLLAEALGWPMEYVVKTHLPKSNPMHVPTSYKIDIANPTHLIAIEVDGMSHTARSRQAQDRKKEQVLAGLGWTVLRFANQEVMEHLQECVQMVRSITSR